MEATWRSPSLALIESSKQYPLADSHKTGSSEPSMTLIRSITPLTQASVKCSMYLPENKNKGRYNWAVHASRFSTGPVLLRVGRMRMSISAEHKLTHPAVVAITSNARGRLFGRDGHLAKSRQHR